MNIPEGYAQINHFFGGTAFPRGAQVTYGVAPVDGASAIHVATEAQAAFEAEWKSQMPSNVTLLKTRCKLGPNDTGAFAETGTSFAGTYSTAPDSPQVAVLMRKATAEGGRHNTGRMFLPVAAEVDTISGGLLDPTAQAGMQTRANNWLADIEGGTYIETLELLHADPLLTPTHIVALTIEAQLATQRRRLRKVGGRRRVIP